MFFTALLPYLSYLFPFIPASILGLNITGWSWALMLVYTLMQFTFVRVVTFCWKYWLPWTAYLVGYLVYDYSYLGLQLTCQYLLPILVGMVASSFTYTDETLRWLFDDLVALRANRHHANRHAGDGLNRLDIALRRGRQVRPLAQAGQVLVPAG